MRLRLFFLTIMLFIAYLCYPQTIFSGKIHNLKHKNLTLNYDLNNIVLNFKKKAVLNPDSEGNFKVVIKDLRYFSSLNWIKVSSKYIYLCLAPNDSLYMDFDVKNLKSVSFKGSNAKRSSFINDFYHQSLNRRKVSRVFNSDTAFSILKTNYNLDSLLLEKYKNSLDTTFYLFFQQALKYDYFNNLTTSGVNFTAKNKAVFNFRNSRLKYYVYYYSSIQGYLYYYLNQKFYFGSVADLKDGFDKADKILTYPYSDIFKAYLIGYFYQSPFKKEIKKSNDLKNFIDDYLNHIDDVIIKEEMTQKLKSKT